VENRGRLFGRAKVNREKHTYKITKSVLMGGEINRPGGGRGAEDDGDGEKIGGVLSRRTRPKRGEGGREQRRTPLVAQRKEGNAKNKRAKKSVVGETKHKHTSNRTRCEWAVGF